MLGLTVHDETHLDALWQVADQIAGPDFPVNPLEAFVFGAAVLLHDTAMALAAYPGGLNEIKNLQIWDDVEAQLGKDRPDLVQFIVLRELHAQQAEELAQISFRRPGRSENLYLLDDVKLRDALAGQVGRIAHSHHWDHSELVSNLNVSTGGVPSYPSEWYVNEIKVACLLRCADAAHIDARRAPTYLYAISDIRGVSDDHWNFQNRLNQIAIESRRIVFNSGTDFPLENASAWWVCFDTLQMIDREIRGCNAILFDQIGIEFEVNGVKGIESPIQMSRYIKTSKWTPVDAQVKVSDPVNLAKRLGGENLYGDSPLPPMRELLQNAADAIRARRALEERDDKWGVIRVSVDSDADGSTILTVDDQGVGMSERVLTGPLIDFGSSFWNSDLARSEFPGLLGRKTKVVGKFGIGFFSTFLLGDHVSVASRRFDAGKSDENVLVFEELTRRPILRNAVTGEIPRDFCTRVRIKIGPRHCGAFQTKWEPSQEPDGKEIADLGRAIRMLICALDVNVQYRNQITGDSWDHSADWMHIPAEVFLEEVTGGKISEVTAARTRLIRERDGTVVGRAAFTFSKERYTRARAKICVGGFSNYLPTSPRQIGMREFAYDNVPGSLIVPPMEGIIVGETSDVVRARAVPVASAAAIADWATEQASLLDRKHYFENELVEACLLLMESGADPGDLPFAVAGGKFVSWPDVIRIIKSSGEILIGISRPDYHHHFETATPDTMGSLSISGRLKSNYILVSSEHNLDWLSEEETDEIISGNSAYQITESGRDALLDIFEIEKKFGVFGRLCGESSMFH